MLKYIMNCSREFCPHNNTFYILLKIIKLIKISVLNLLYYLIFDGPVIKFYLLKKTFLSTYVLSLVKPLSLTEMTELPELYN